jgi:hypothetical protein
MGAGNPAPDGTLLSCAVWPEISERRACSDQGDCDDTHAYTRAYTASVPQEIVSGLDSRH